MASRVMIDADLCIGSGECVRLIPTAFRLDDELGISIPLPGARDVPPDRLFDAESGCPTGAITILDEDAP